MVYSPHGHARYGEYWANYVHLVDGIYIALLSWLSLSTSHVKNWDNIFTAMQRCGWYRVIFVLQCRRQIHVGVKNRIFENQYK